MKKFKEKFIKNSNEGFSLVELIIVIAIMAILVGVIALQVLPYMERSRVGKDQQTIDTVYNAFQIALTDSAVADDVTVEISDTTATASSAMSDAFWMSMGNNLAASNTTDAAGVQNTLGEGTAAKLVSAEAIGAGITCEYIHDTKTLRVFATGDTSIVVENKAPAAS